MLFHFCSPAYSGCSCRHPSANSPLLSRSARNGSFSATPLRPDKDLRLLLDLLPSAKLGAVRSLLEVMIEDDDGQLTRRTAPPFRPAWIPSPRTAAFPMEDVLADFDLTMADFEKLAATPDSAGKR